MLCEGPERGRVAAALRRTREALVRDVNATRGLLGRGDGHFELFGAHFLPTRNLRMYHTEVQRDPAAQAIPEKARVVAPAVGGAATLAAEVLQRRRDGRPLDRLDCLPGSGYGWLVNEARQPPYYFSADGCAASPGDALCGQPGSDSVDEGGA